MESDGDSLVRGRGRRLPKERDNLRRPFIDVGVESSDKPNARPNVLQSSLPEKVVSSSSSVTLGNVVDSGSNVTVSQNALYPPTVRPNNNTTGTNSSQSVSANDFDASNEPPVSLVKATNSNLSPFAQEFVPRNSLKESFIPYLDYQEEIGDSCETGSWFHADSYPVSELREFIYEVTLNPGKYESRVQILVETLESSISDEETMRAVANTIFDQAITEPNFRYTAARLCNHLYHSLNLPFGSFKYFLLQRCQQEHKRNKELVVASDGGNYLRGFTIFLGELFSQIEVIVGDVKEKLWIFGKAVAELLDVLLSYPSEDNLKCVCQVLKFTGATLEDHERHVSGGHEAPEMDKIINSIKELTANFDIRSNISSLLLSIVDLRASDWGRITPSPAVYNDSVVAENNMYGVVYYGPDGQPVSSEEVAFLQNTCSNSSYSYIMNGESYGPEDPDVEVMDDEMQAAFEQFLRESGQ